MNKLGDRNYTLIERGAKCCGTLDPSVILPVFEEQLYVSEMDEIEAFLQWCHDNKKCFGHGNYEQRFAEFKQTQEADAVLFDRFKESREVVGDLAARTHNSMDDNKKGIVYSDSTGLIGQIEIDENGKYHVLAERSEILTQDLDEAERWLWDNWAKYEYVGVSSS